MIVLLERETNAAGYFPVVVPTDLLPTQLLNTYAYIFIGDGIVICLYFVSRQS